MGHFTHTAKSENLNPGDHIYSWRKLKSYAHHGIYMGNGMVIHFISPKGRIKSRSTKICEKCCDHRKRMMGDAKKAVEEISISCLECFLHGGKLKLAVYSVSDFETKVKRTMTCFTATADPPEKVLERVTSILESGFGNYNLLLNNCEDFAFYCKTGNNCPPEREKKISIFGKNAAGFYHNVRTYYKWKATKSEGDEDGGNQRV